MQKTVFKRLTNDEMKKRYVYKRCIFGTFHLFFDAHSMENVVFSTDVTHARICPERTMDFNGKAMFLYSQFIHFIEASN